MYVFCTDVAVALVDPGGEATTFPQPEQSRRTAHTSGIIPKLRLTAQYPILSNTHVDPSFSRIKTYMMSVHFVLRPSPRTV